jgi:CxxC-x17-CxxC domain-containing protein
MLQPKNLTCTECGAIFIFSTGEQEFFNQRNLVNEPRRCPGCRLSMRFMRNGRDASQLSDVSCADCQKPTRVPFKPRGLRPVFCYDCLAQRKQVMNEGVAAGA